MDQAVLASARPRYTPRRLLLLILFAVTVPGMLFGVFFASIQIFPRRSPNVKTPATHGLRYEDLAFAAADGVPTRGWYLPPPKAPAPVIVAVHGHVGRREQFLNEAKFLVQAGYGVVMPELRQHGESGGGPVTFGLREAEELKPYIEYVRARPEHRGQKLGLIGWSMGAVTVLKAAANDPTVDAVVADSPFASLSAQSRHRIGLIVPKPLAGYCWAFALITGCAFAGELPPAWEVTEWLPSIQPRPIFFVHGLDDNNIPPSATRTLMAVAKPQNVEAWYTDGVRHIDTRNVHAAEYARRVTAFFDRTLRGR